MKKIYWLVLLLYISFFQACNPTVDVYAIEKELYIVYGVLNPAAGEQYVTITKVFQTESDALVFATENDLSARNMLVSIRMDSTIWNGQLVDVPAEGPGLFSKTTGAYRFETSGSQALTTGKNYTLEIRKPEDSTFLISANSIVPDRPFLKSPGAPIYSQQQGVYTLPSMDFDGDQLVQFDRGGGFGFELRLYARFWNGVENKIAMWGPTRVFSTPRNCRANSFRNEMCYVIPGISVPNALRSYFLQPSDTVILDDSIRISPNVQGLSKNVWLEVTAIDTFLTAYLTSNTPYGYGLNLLQDRKEIDNISGDHAGLFGAFSTHSQFLFLGSCTRYLAGLPGNRPPDCGN